jgi:hypothetical protein
MIFQHTLPNILNETKTQTRRIIKADEQVVRGRHNKIHAVLLNGRTKWQVGKTYAVQPARGTCAIARIKLTKIRSEYITRISTKDAIAEGFADRQDFLATWRNIHGLSGLNVRVWVIEFELVSVIVSSEMFIKQEFAKKWEKVG